jgi:hypothetical protein
MRTRNQKLVKFIPVDNDINKAIAFANTLDADNIKNIQRIKTKEFYIPTVNVIEKLQDEGWHIAGVNEQRSKSRKISNNYVQMQHPDFAIKNSKGKNEALASLTITNSCNGNKPLQLDLGVYRQVCSNGLMVREEFATERFRHIQIDYNNLVNKLNLFGNKVDKVLNKFNNLKEHTLSDNLMRQFAIEAASLRFTPEEVNSRVEDLLRVSRLEDEGNNLWTVYNRVQENLTHDIRNPNMDIKLNQQLFTLAESYI